MTNFDFFADFNQISAKQWKQKIQFLLNGEDYNTKCISFLPEKVNILPFYNQEMADIPFFSLKNKTEFIVEETLDYKNYKAKDNIFLFDPISNFAETGNFFKTEKQDFEDFKNFVKKENIIYIDGGFLQEAGANAVQQVAYLLSILDDYLLYLQKIPSSLKVIFQVGISPFFWREISKINALYWCFSSIFKDYNIKIQVVAKNSQRYQSLFKEKQILNHIFDKNAVVTGFLSGCDFVLCKDLPVKTDLFLLKNKIEKSYFFRNLSFEFAKKSLNIWKEISKKGFIFQLKNRIIQKKIKENAEKEQKKYQKNMNLSSFDLVENSNEILIKKTHTKTLIEPIFGRRLYQDIEIKYLSK